MKFCAENPTFTKPQTLNKNTMKKRVICALFIPLLCGFYTKPHQLKGKYQLINQEFGGHNIVFERNGTFTETVTGCVYSFEIFGTSKIENDTLILLEHQRKDLRSQKINVVENNINRYLIRNDTLYPIDETTKIRTGKYFALVKVK